MSIGLGILIFIFSPVDTLERRLNTTEKLMIKKKLKKILPSYIGIILFGEAMNLKYIGYTLFYTLLFVLFLQLIGILKNNLKSCYIG